MCTCFAIRMRRYFDLTAVGYAADPGSASTPTWSSSKRGKVTPFSEGPGHAEQSSLPMFRTNGSLRDICVGSYTQDSGRARRCCAMQ